MTTKALVHRYYEAWAAQDRDAARAALHDELAFTSPQDRFESADAFLSACWKYSTGLTGVRFLKEVVDGDAAFVILAWTMDDGGSFVGAEYVETADGRVAEILVVRNDPSFGSLVTS